MKNSYVFILIIIVAIVSFFLGQYSLLGKDPERTSLKSERLGAEIKEDFDSFNLNSIIPKEDSKSAPVETTEQYKYANILQENNLLSSLKKPQKRSIGELAENRANILAKSIRLRPELVPVLAEIISKKMLDDVEAYAGLSSFIDSNPESSLLLLSSDEDLTNTQRLERDDLLQQEFSESFTEKIGRSRQNYENEIRSLLSDDEIHDYITHGINELIKFRAQNNDLMIETIGLAGIHLSDDQINTMNESLAQTLYIDPADFVIGSTVEAGGADSFRSRSTYSIEHSAMLQKIVRESLTVRQTQKLERYFITGQAG